ncbi:MAG: hypothetical protein JSR21_13190 [Proteobacteria bacterium]|nr:hypothetical protein [Pseudomonadota bacterium]
MILRHWWRAVLALAALLPLVACNLPPPDHDMLYPPDAAGLSDRFIITHDRYHPWQFQPYGFGERGN